MCWVSLPPANLALHSNKGLNQQPNGFQNSRVQLILSIYTAVACCAVLLMGLQLTWQAEVPQGLFTMGLPWHYPELPWGLMRCWA